MVEAGWQFRRTIPSIAPRGAARLAQRSEALALQPGIFIQFAKRKAPACHPQRPCAGTGKTGRAERFICGPSALPGRGRRAAECLVRDRLAESVAGIQTNRSASRFQTTGQGRPAENPLIAQQSRRKLAGYKRLQIVQAFANAYPVDRHGPHALPTRSNRRSEENTSELQAS